MELSALLKYAVDNEGSDLHVKVGSVPHLRVDGHLQAAPFPGVTPADTESMATPIIPVERRDEFARLGQVDFAHSVPGLGRFRVTVFRQRGSIGMAFRRVRPGVPSLESLHLPAAVTKLADESRGLVLVTGVVGSGKTTTAAAMVDHINTSRAVNIVTIEDPIEVLHTDKMALVNQREIGTDTTDFGEAMRAVLRQDPDVVFIGELRDAETVSAALTAAETGHLVLSTMHTASAAETVARLVDFYSPSQHRQIRLALASSLRGIISQRLLERVDGKGRAAAVEILLNTARVFDAIAEPNEDSGLHDLIAEGEGYGMQTFEQSLLGLYKDEVISLRDAMAASLQPHEFRVALQQAGLLAAT